MPTSLTEYNFIEKIRVACKVFATLLLVSCSVNLYAHPPSGSSDFQKVPIATDLANAVDFEIADDGRIFILNRYGELLVYSPTTQNTVVGATFNVYTGVEAGLIGIAFDPGFASNQFVYLYYSPPSPSVNRLSRFTMLGNQLQPSSEVILLEVPVNRQQGHHDGGNLEFDNFGNLYIGTGDDTFPSNYAPLDETDHRKSAEKSSANSMDLRGKILRIRPLPGGGYSIPSGNLFTELSQGLPEIYVMGARNPYKFSIDPATNWLFWGDIGPDANLDGPEGPSGKDEINLTKESGNFGWPHFIGPNLPYLNTYLNYYFDPAAPTNDSIWNTGPRLLPPAEGAWITVARASYMAGPVYHFDDQNLNPNRLPESFDNHFFYWDFNTSRVWFVEFDENGQLLINEEWTELAEPGRGYIDFEIGPDDQLYVLEYGTGCCALDVGNGTLHRVDFVGEHGNRSPVVSMTATPRSGSLPLEVSFSSVGSFDPDGDPISYRWDFESDGIDDAFTPDAVHTYQTPGIVNAQLVVSDPLGAESFGNVAIHAGNNIAEVDFVAPLEGSLFEWNEFVDVEVSVTDEEDGSISGGGIQCSEVEVQSALGHLEHAHDSTLISNCTGQIQFFSDHNTNGEDQLYYQLQARYTDQDNLASFKVIKLFPKQFAAEFNDESGGTELIANTDNQFASVNAIRATDTQSFIVFENRDLVGIDGVSYRVASDSNTAEIQLRLDSVDGPLVKTVPIPNSGGASNWIDAASNFVPPNGLHDLFFVFVGTPGLAGLL
ncbi:MAG: PQQ-dependent sugar dehydrogenase, partial [Gammaproteobacteria bacterium]|nr:PQQ-dependent sugar dehydrogenase [Gammaproteobacteria bacterium]